MMSLKVPAVQESVELPHRPLTRVYMMGGVTIGVGFIYQQDSLLPPPLPRSQAPLLYVMNQLSVPSLKVPGRSLWSCQSGLRVHDDEPPPPSLLPL